NVNVTYNLFYLVGGEQNVSCGTIINGTWSGTGSDVGNNRVIYTSVGFANLSLPILGGKDYRLTTNVSPNYKGTASDGTDPGANLIDTATVFANAMSGGGGTPPSGPTALLEANVNTVSPGVPGQDTVSLKWTATGTGITSTLTTTPPGTPENLTPAT